MTKTIANFTVNRICVLSSTVGKLKLQNFFQKGLDKILKVLYNYSDPVNSLEKLRKTKKMNPLTKSNYNSEYLNKKSQRLVTYKGGAGFDFLPYGGSFFLRPLLFFNRKGK